MPKITPIIATGMRGKFYIDDELIGIARDVTKTGDSYTFRGIRMMKGFDPADVQDAIFKMHDPKDMKLIETVDLSKMEASMTASDGLFNFTGPLSRRKS